MHACMQKQERVASFVRRALNTRASVAGVENMQFPCVIRAPQASLADMTLHPVFMHALSTDEGLLDTEEAVSIFQNPALLHCDDVCAALGIEFTDEKMITSTSHGDVRFGVVKLSRADGKPPKEIDVAIKCLPIGAADMFRASNSAYADPYGAWVGSQMLHRGLSSGFIALYGTFVCTGKVKDMTEDGPIIIMISERVRGGNIERELEKLITPEHIDWPALIALLLQVFLVFAHTHAAALTHNDAHMGNILTSDTCTQAPLYMNIEGHVLRVPVSCRVVLMDFGRSTAGAFQCDPVTGLCRLQRDAPRLRATEITNKFPQWEMDDHGGDMTHFLAMLMLFQPEPGYFVKMASMRSAPPMARAFLRLMRASLQCDSGSDMFAAYDTTETNNSSYVKHVIHKLRNKDEGCHGLRPIDWLSDPELTAAFEATEPIAPDAVIYSPRPFRARR